MVSLLYQEIFQAALPSVAAALTHLSAALKNPLAIFFSEIGKNSVKQKAETHQDFPNLEKIRGVMHEISTVWLGNAGVLQKMCTMQAGHDSYRML